MNKPIDLTKRPGRRIRVAGHDWVWRVGRFGHVIAYSDTGKRRLAHASALKGITPDEWERGKYKGTNSGQLYPREVAAWLAGPKLKSVSVAGEGPKVVPVSGRLAIVDKYRGLFHFEEGQTGYRWLEEMANELRGIE